MKIWLQYIVPFTLVSFFFITQRMEVDTGGAYNVLFGFPYPCISESWSTALHHSVYIGPLLFDLMIYGLLWTVFFTVLQPGKRRLRTHWISILVVLALAGTLTYFQYTQWLSGYNTYSWGYDLNYAVQLRELNWGLYP